jgi:hypothetical protein
MATPDEIRASAVLLAKCYVGLNADPSDPESRLRYLDLIAPGESDGKQSAMADESGCGLVVAGIWRALGVGSQLLNPPYKIGTGLSRLLQIGQAARAWVNYGPGKVPSPGDAVIVGDNGKGGVQHIYTVTSISTDDGVLIGSIDGGQRDSDRFQTILEKQRVWKAGRDIVVQGNDPGASHAGGRVIVGWIDVTQLPGVG